jgi:hypothetical protein
MTSEHEAMAWVLRKLYALRCAEAGLDPEDAALLASADFLESWGQYLRGEVSHDM